MDSHDDIGGGQWLTYEELAKARGIQRLAAVRLTQRHKWRRQRGNDGHARVLVPDDMLPRGVATVTTTDPVTVATTHRQQRRSTPRL
jgi:hypothetical protein